MRYIESKQGQWIGDVAIKHAGSIEVLFELAVGNDLSITDDLPAGTELLCATVMDKRIINYMQRNGIEPATKIYAVDDEGIEFWIIERDFIVT
jgi:hypothetical protein